jgi:hypothetical protein
VSSEEISINMMTRKEEIKKGRKEERKKER